MGRYEPCAVCGKYDYSDRHKCNPKWECSILEEDPDGEDFRPVHGLDAEEAAEKCVQQSNDNSAEYPEEPRTVLVRTKEGLKRFKVHMEYERTYSAFEEEL